MWDVNCGELGGGPQMPPGAPCRGAQQGYRGAEPLNYKDLLPVLGGVLPSHQKCSSRVCMSALLLQPYHKESP